MGADQSVTSQAGPWIALYLDHVEAAGRQPKTVHNYATILKQFAARLHGWPPLDLDVRDFLDTRGTVNCRLLALTTLRQWFTFLRNRGLLELDPSKSIPSPRARRRDYAPVAPEAFARLVRALQCTVTRVVATVLYRAGPRIEELLAVRVEEIIFDGDYGTIDLSRRKGGEPGFAAFGPEVTSVLRPYLAGRAGSAFPVKSDYVRHRLARAGRLAGIPGRLTPHRLRHAFATWAVDSGWNQLALQQQLGHRNAQSTARYYHPSRAGLIAAYRRAQITT